MYIFVLFKSITQKAKLMKANTFLYTLNIYKILNRNHTNNTNITEPLGLYIFIPYL